MAAPDTPAEKPGEGITLSLASLDDLEDEEALVAFALSVTGRSAKPKEQSVASPPEDAVEGH